MKLKQPIATLHKKEIRIAGKRAAGKKSCKSGSKKRTGKTTLKMTLLR